MYKELLRSAPEVCLDSWRPGSLPVTGGSAPARGDGGAGASRRTPGPPVQAPPASPSTAVEADARVEEAIRGCARRFAFSPRTCSPSTATDTTPTGTGATSRRDTSSSPAARPENSCQEGTFLIRMLERETDPWILSVREQLVAAAEALEEAVTDAEQTDQRAGADLPASDDGEAALGSPRSPAPA